MKLQTTKQRGRQHKIKTPVETYVTDRSERPSKIEINNLIAQEFKKRRGYYIILESEKRFTLKTLKKAGVDLNKVEVPNPYVFSSIKKWHKKTYNMLLSEYLDGVISVGETETFGGVWFDYCCTIEGNQTVNPKEDLKKYFENKLPNDNSILAFTFSARSVSKQSYKYQGVVELINYVQRVAYDNGYVAIKHPCWYVYKDTSAGATMYFDMFEIRKR